MRARAAARYGILLALILLLGFLERQLPPVSTVPMTRSLTPLMFLASLSGRSETSGFSL